MPEKRNRSFVTFEKCYLDKIDWYDSSEVYNDLVMLFENANKNLLKIDSALISGINAPFKQILEKDTIS